MDDNTTKIIKDKFDSLPEEIKEVILSSHYEESLIEIGKQHGLNVEQLGILERETTLVMMGLTPTKDFETELTRELKVEKFKGSQIVKDLNEKIFLKIRELLKLMNTPAGEKPSLEGEEEQTNTALNDDNQILNSAGIEIIKEEKRELVPEKPHPILVQKLSGQVKNEVIETEHSIENFIEKNTPIQPNTTSVVPKIDPYREIPE